MTKVRVTIRSKGKPARKDFLDSGRAAVAKGLAGPRKKKKAAKRKGSTWKGRRRREPPTYVCAKCGEAVEIGKRNEHLLAKHGVESKRRMTPEERAEWKATKFRPPRIKILQGGAPGMGKKK